MRTMINDIKTTITGTFSIDATDMTTDEKDNLVKEIQNCYDLMNTTKYKVYATADAVNIDYKVTEHIDPVQFENELLGIIPLFDGS